MTSKKLNSKKYSEKNQKILSKTMALPWKRWQEEYCSKCDQNCNPSEDRFRNCVLCGFTFALTELANKPPKRDTKDVDRITE